MNSQFAALPAHFMLNPHHADGDYPAALRDVQSENAAADAVREIASWPGYAQTPLVSLPSLACDFGLEQILLKDEAGRFGLRSFKALGGAYAVYRVLAGVVKRQTSEWPSAADMAAGRYADLTRSVTVGCATDGNHGRSVAWGAQMFGCACTIFIHATVSEARADAIAAYGAQVVRSSGTYDDAVREAAKQADANGWVVVSDTSYPGYVDIPRDVMSGYSVMVDEVLRQLQAEGEHPPTHVFIQGGVGGLAAAVTARLWQILGDARPHVTVVEPMSASCLFASAEAGKATGVTGDLDTIMAGLSCGEASVIAWRILDPGAYAFMSITDDAAAETMRLLAEGKAGPPIVSGESGVAGLAGLFCLAGHVDWRQSIGLNKTSRVLVISTEGDTDPEVYLRIVGASADTVRGKYDDSCKYQDRSSPRADCRTGQDWRASGRRRLPARPDGGGPGGTRSARALDA